MDSITPKVPAHLVIPPVGASSNLNATLEVIRPTQKVVAEFSQVVWMGIVETHDKECVVDHL